MWKCCLCRVAGNTAWFRNGMWVAVWVRLDANRYTSIKLTVHRTMLFGPDAGSRGAVCGRRRGTAAGRWTGRGQFVRRAWTTWSGERQHRGRSLRVGERVQLLGQLFGVVRRQRSSAERGRRRPEKPGPEEPGVIAGRRPILLTSTATVEDLGRSAGWCARLSINRRYCPQYMRSRVYATVVRPSVRLSVRPIRSPLLQVCCCGPGGRRYGSIAARPAVSSSRAAVAAQRTAANAGSTLHWLHYAAPVTTRVAAVAPPISHNLIPHTHHRNRTTRYIVRPIAAAAAAVEVRRVRRWRCTATKCCRSCHGTACDFGVRPITDAQKN